jgi:hypothetical protein
MSAILVVTSITDTNISATWHWIQRYAKNLDHKISMHEQAGCYGKSAYPYYIGKRVLHGWSDIELPKSAYQEYLEVSSTYGRIYFSLLEKLWQLRVLDSRAVTEVEHDQVRGIIIEYDTLWDEWYKLERNHLCCATLYMTCWPPTWREKRNSKSVQLHHYTELIRKYRKFIAKAG